MKAQIWKKYKFEKKIKFNFENTERSYARRPKKNCINFLKLSLEPKKKKKTPTPTSDVVL